MMELRARSVGVLRDEEAGYEALVMAELQAGEGARLEVQRALEPDARDRAAGTDTYVVAVESGATHHGGVRAWAPLADGARLALEDVAAATLGVDREFVIRFTGEQERETAVSALERLVGPPASP